MTESDIAWRPDWPTAVQIRVEVEAYVESVTEVLTEAIPASALRGLYYKGSALKQWDSALDYVPEISDVDFHLWFATDEDVKTHFGSVEFALGPGETRAGL